MDTLDNTEWDVLIVGTGLKQSLLALALSRSGKKILHIDENKYYGGADAAFSLQEAEEFSRKIGNDSTAAASTNTTTSKPELVGDRQSAPVLSPSRAYTLALSPQLIYARSALLQSLISSKIYRQLDFVAVGSWWVYSVVSGKEDPEGETWSDTTIRTRGTLIRVPNGREDVFQDQVLDFKAKRALMKFLRFIGEYEDQPEIWVEHKHQPFPEFLSEHFKVPAILHAPLLALTLSLSSARQTTTGFALPRIAMHLRSIGVFGPGFGSVVPKWGGMSEIAQVACRACAVGGATYVLDKSVDDQEEVESGVKLLLKDGETVTAQWVIQDGDSTGISNPAPCKAVAIVSSTLAPLFPSLGDEAPSAACAVVVFSSESLSLGDEFKGMLEVPPVHIVVHSSDTGECPTGQSVLYASTSLNGVEGSKLIDTAFEALLASVDVPPSPTILWSMQYQTLATSPLTPSSSKSSERILRFSPPSSDLVFDDAVLDEVKEVWQKLVGEQGGEFLEFDDREPNVDDDE